MSGLGLGDWSSGEKLALVGVGVAAMVALVVLAHLAGQRRMARWDGAA